MAGFLRRFMPVAITPIVAACYFTTDFTGLSSGTGAEGGVTPIEAGGAGDGGDGGIDAAPKDDGATGTSYRDMVVADKPLAYWRLGDTDMRAKDEVGTSHGQYVGKAVHGPGIPGSDTAAVFDGSNYVDLGNGFGFTNRDNFSIEAWIKPDANTTGTACVIAKNEGPADSNPTQGWALYLDAPPSRGLNASRYRDSTEEGALSPTIPTTRLTHFVVTYDGSTMKIFLDGKLAKEAGGVTRSILEITNHLTIGASRGGGACRFRGTIDEVAIYGVPLGFARIEAHYQRGLTP